MPNRPTADELRAVLRYYPETGHLHWRPRKGLGSRAWGEAFTTVTTRGYRQGTVLGYRTSAHRVAWAYVTGEWPEQIDHINGDKLDNRIANLRAVCATENQRNRAVQGNSKSGVPGVRWRAGKWEAVIYVASRQISLGRYSDFEEAVKARKEAEKEHGFHPNHGRAAHG